MTPAKVARRHRAGVAASDDPSEAGSVLGSAHPAPAGPPGGAAACLRRRGKSRKLAGASSGKEKPVYLALGLVMPAAGAAMLWLGAPGRNVSPAFMRNGAAEMLWPVACLGLLVCGAAGVVTGSGRPW